jgi:hypothetical protein
MWLVSAAMRLLFNNTAKVPARHFTVHYDSRLFPLEFKVSHQKTDDDVFRSVEGAVG